MKTEAEVLNKLYDSLVKKWKPVQAIEKRSVLYASDWDGAEGRYDYVEVEGSYLEGGELQLFAVVKGGPSTYSTRVDSRLAYTVLLDDMFDTDLTAKRPLPIWRTRWPYGEVMTFGQHAGQRISYKTSSMGPYDEVEVPEDFVADGFLYKDSTVEFLKNLIIDDLKKMEPKRLSISSS